MSAPALTFDLDDTQSYAVWRDQKLANYPKSWQDLVVHVQDPKHLSIAEKLALQHGIQSANMVIYASAMLDEDPQIPVQVAQQLGMHQLDANWLADEDGVSHIAVTKGQGDHTDYIPYTTRGLLWHTDGYYHPQDRSISGMVLHCVRSAQSGGLNQLVDHERIYIALRDENPQWIAALMHPQAMTIPARLDEQGRVGRAAQTGPVFSVMCDAQGYDYLHMRYTARTRSIEWRDDALTHAAVKRLQALLNTPSDWIFELKMTPGMGLISHNVLHTRSEFEDDVQNPRLIYRARYVDRVNLQALENDEVLL
jgi:Taurine catabolism dioxygenase TauD, TfdA family